MKRLNIGIMAHVDAGKTSVTEQFLYHTGAIRTIGSVDKGTAHTDFLGVERSRGISVKAAVTMLETPDAAINLIDTPGHVDFSGEVERALMVIDGIILVVSAVEGVQAQTEIIWEALKKRGIPVIFFINKIDRTGADTGTVISQIRERLTPELCILYNAKNQGQQDASVEKTDITECMADRDEKILEAYLLGNVTGEMVREAARRKIQSAELFPVLCGSAMYGTGISELLESTIEFFPNAEGDREAPLSGIVFKMDYDPVMGKIAHVRLYQGTLRNRAVVKLIDGNRNQNTNRERFSIQNGNRTQNRSQSGIYENRTQNRSHSGLADPSDRTIYKSDEKITQIRKFFGEKYKDTGFLEAGDIAAVCGLTSVSVGDIIGSGEAIPEIIKWVKPLLNVSVNPADQKDFQALVKALFILNEEDPLLEFYASKETGELLLSITGMIQTEVLTEILKSRFNLDVTFGKPSVIYKETPAAEGEGFDAYTMPKPCWAVLKFNIKPGLCGSGIAYRSEVSPNKIPYRYQNHVETAVQRALRQGLKGWEVIDADITLVDGEYHEIHTHPLDFFVATPMALMKGLQNSGTILLEPVLSFRITAPEEFSGKIIGEIINMRGTFESPSIENGRFIITGRFPASTLLDFPVRLASITSGKGIISTRFHSYQKCPEGIEATMPYRGVNPLDRSKFILWARNAFGHFGDAL